MQKYFFALVLCVLGSVPAQASEGKATEFYPCGSTQSKTLAEVGPGMHCGCQALVGCWIITNSCYLIDPQTANPNCGGSCLYNCGKYKQKTTECVLFVNSASSS